MDWFYDLISNAHLNWVALGLFLGIFEMLAPGASMLWIGGAAMVTGIVVWLFPDTDWRWQIIIFGLLGITAIVGSRRIFARTAAMDGATLLNNRTETLVGRVATLETAIENGEGRAKIHDISWTVTGPDMPAGSKVRVIDADGLVLQVERAV